ncbi:MAG: cyclic nucleotide-binding domain-containing protein [Candidatus Riflebacteria bacterium]|nr:cyclic nucleotide-binding domain-containing protein [Candidatus Riflebacteria bacterium]
MGLSPDVDTKVKLMKSLRFFSGFSAEEMALVAQISDFVKCNPGDIIFAEGDPATFFYIILKGTVFIIKHNGNELERLHLAILAGECLGEMSFISGKPRAAHAIAHDEIFLFKIDGQKLERAIITLQLKIYKKFSQMLANRLTTAARILNKQP